MSDDPPRSMSLVPYAPTDSREVVLRHGSAVVVFDQQSKQLSLRDTSSRSTVDSGECPYCHRPYRQNHGHTPDDEDRHQHADLPDVEPGYVDPGYFQMLRRSQPTSQAPSRPTSPHKQIASGPLRALDSGSAGSGATSSTGIGQVPPQHHGISQRAFSPNYFKDFFIEEKILGRGGKGVVMLVRHVLDGVSLGEFACKRVPVGDDHEWLEKVLTEVQLLQNLSHQNLVSYRHVWLEDYQISSFGPSVPCAFILQQYCNAGDLHHYILEGSRSTMTTAELKERIRRRSKGQLEEPIPANGPRKMHWEQIVAFFKDITSGLNHLHANGYIHRDLKPSNCLLHSTGQHLRVLVSDFGEVQAVNMARKSTGATGTISYCAPEVLTPVRPGGPLGNFTTKSDIFSLGMIVYFMCFGRLPYQNADGIDEDNEDLDRLREEISAWAGFNDEERVRSDLPDRLYASLKHLLSLNPKDRPGTEEILKAFKSSTVFNEVTGFNGPSLLDEMEPRISRADTPSPTSTPHRRKRSSLHYTRPGPSKLNSPAVEDSRSPSPTPVDGTAPVTNSTLIPDSSVVLRPRKSVGHSHVHSVTPSPSSSPIPSLSHVSRLMLPPPPEPRLSLVHQALSNPTFINFVRFSLFIVKVGSLMSFCLPLAVNPWAACLLIFLSVMDFSVVRFRLGERLYHELIQTVVLAVVHFAVLWLLVRWDGVCVNSGKGGVDWEDSISGDL